MGQGRAEPGEQVFAKCAGRLIPFLMLLYFFNYLDRVNVGFAALTMNKDLGFSPEIFGFGAGIFFFSYALSQVPFGVIQPGRPQLGGAEGDQRLRARVCVQRGTGVGRLGGG